jgi:putative ABC transport system permease protein
VRLTAAAVEPAHYFQAFQFSQGERTAAFQALRRGEGVLIPAALATEMELKVGDPLPLRAGDRTGEFIVAGVIAHSFPSPDNFGAVIVPRDAAQTLFGVTTFRFLAVSAAPDADLAQLTRELASTAESFGMAMGTQADLARTIGDAVGGLLGLLAGLVAIGVIVGSLGLVNTMMMNLAQRARDIGILRAVGMARGQVRGLAIAEASIMGFLGAVLGVALGAFITAVLVDLSRTADLDPRFVFSLPLAAAVLVAGVVVAVIASLYPAARAVRTDIVETIRQG